MTMKEKLQIHCEIEKENAEHLRTWNENKKKPNAAAAPDAEPHQDREVG